MKNLSRVATLVALALTFGAQANDSQQNSGFSVTSEVGFGHQKVDVSGGYKTESGNSFSPSIALAYSFNNNTSIVAQYTDYGETELFSGSDFLYGERLDLAYSAKTTGLSLVGQYLTDRVVDSWSFGGKLGLMAWETDMIADIQYMGQDVSETEKDDGVAIYGGLLATYGISENVDVVFNADWFVSDVDVEVINGEKTELLRARYSVGVTYHF